MASSPGLWPSNHILPCCLLLVLLLRTGVQPPLPRTCCVSLHTIFKECPPRSFCLAGPIGLIRRGLNVASLGHVCSFLLSRAQSRVPDSCVSIVHLPRAMLWSPLPVTLMLSQNVLLLGSVLAYSWYSRPGVIDRLAQRSPLHLFTALGHHHFHASEQGGRCAKSTQGTEPCKAGKESKMRGAASRHVLADFCSLKLIPSARVGTTGIRRMGGRGGC